MLYAWEGLGVAEIQPEEVLSSASGPPGLEQRANSLRKVAKWEGLSLWSGHLGFKFPRFTLRHILAG